MMLQKRIVVSLICLLVVSLTSGSSLADPGQAPRAFSQYDAAILPLIERMTLIEKVGQMTQGELGSLGDLKDIRELCLGSVLSGGNSDPQEGNSIEAWSDTYDACQKQALETRLGIPILYGVDAVHGHNNIAHAVIFPHNVGLGCTRNEALVEEIGYLTAQDVRATGIQWTFAPCVTVPRDDRWGRTYEGFSEDPQLVALLGAASIRGLQGDSLGDSDRVLACAKHFTGDGGTVPEERDSHHGDFEAGIRHRLDQGDTQCDEATLRELHIRPYLDAVEAGVGSIMPSYSSWNGEKCSGSYRLLTEILKEELGFEGFLISDYSAIDQIDPDYKTAIAQCINAGVDMAMVPDRHREFHTLLIELVNEGVVPQERIDDAVRRILRVKAAMGMLDDNASTLTERSRHAKFSGPHHQEVARRAVRESLVVLKNEADTLPLSRSMRRIHVSGEAANDLGRQCGGWTISWQGEKNRKQLTGVTILEAIRKAAGPNVTVDYSPDGAGASGADVAIVVVGEMPYAEGPGDDFALTLDPTESQLIERVDESSTPLVVLFISGRPLAVTEEIDRADAAVAVWLPGTAGEGVADILFGDFPATGRLGFSWPHSANDHPINFGEKGYSPLFPVGHGSQPVTD